MSDFNDRMVRRLGGEGYVPPPVREPGARPTMRPAPDGTSSPSVAGHGAGHDGYGYINPPEPPPALAAPDRDPNTVAFSRAYQAHGEDVRRVRFRKPVTRDIKQAGNPIKAVVGTDGRLADLEIKWDVVAKYVVMLSDPPLPPSTVDSLEYEDLDACAGVIAGFFVKTA